MPDKNLTDNEIVKALECCGRNSIAGRLNECKNCPLNDRTTCISELMYNALDLINRQKAEIERLKESLNIELENFATEYDNKIKAEARKEFAEKANTQRYIRDIIIRNKLFVRQG